MFSQNKKEAGVTMYENFFSTAFPSVQSRLHILLTKLNANKRAAGKIVLFLLTFSFLKTARCVDAVSSPIGPCSINAGLTQLPSLSPPFPKLPGANPQLKCTEKGYFELVQCFENYCVCVDPGTGAEAAKTKTSSNRVSPQCGRCHYSLSRYYKKSDDFLFRPICEAKTGNYAPTQCKDDDHCFCVNILNGLKLSASEKTNAQTKCDEGQFDFSIDDSQISKNEKLPGGSTVEQHIPIGNPICKLAKDEGNRCLHSARGSGGVKWYFDTETFECLAFAYNGCGGNKNRFDSVVECWEQCKLADMAGCAGMRLPATNAQGHTIVCASIDAGGSPLQSCPSGYRCTMLTFMGVCCHSNTQDIYERNYRPICINGKQPIRMEAGGTPANLIGKRCSDSFCPSGTNCIEKEIFSHCCPR